MDSNLQWIKWPDDSEKANIKPFYVSIYMQNVNSLPDCCEKTFDSVSRNFCLDKALIYEVAKLLQSSNDNLL